MELYPICLAEEKIRYNPSDGTYKGVVALEYVPEPEPHFEAWVSWFDKTNPANTVVHHIPPFTHFGNLLIEGFKAVYPDEVASLPKTKEEWVVWQQRLEQRSRELAANEAANPSPRLTQDEIWALL